MAMIRPETEMKDSGIEWIGNIPNDWKVSRVGNFFSFSSGDSLTNEDIRDDGMYLVYGANGIRGYYFKYNLDKKRILLGRVGALAGNVHIVDEKVWVTEHALIASDKLNLVEEYYGYVFESMNLIQYSKSSAQPVISGDTLQKLRFPVPELSEQQAIADYLDETCSKIDEIIAEAKASIDEYKELKQSVIFEAVTKGLDKNVEMKDSGIEWIGKTPVDWNIAKINRVAWTTSGATPLRSKETEYYDNAVIRWVRTLDLNNGHVTDSSEKITETALKNSSCSIMPVKTVCVAMYGGAGTIGKSGILEVECATNQAICSIVSDKKVLNPDYLHYVIMAVRKYWMKYAVGTRKDPNINQQIIAQMRIPIPQLSKQDIIVNHLDKVTDKCDSLITEKESLINDLEAYKKSLIYEVVTGKRRVV